MSFELFISGRYLKTKQKQTFISLITILSIAGVTVGVMALIVVIAVMSGFESDLKSRILGVESHLVLMNRAGSFSDYRRILDYVENKEGVKAATPFITTQTMLRSSSGVSGAVLRGIDPESAGKVIKYFDAVSLRKISRLNNQINNKANNRPEKLNQNKTNPDKTNQSNNQNMVAPGIILGKELAGALGVALDDMIYLVLPRGMMSPIGHLPAMKRFKVAGFFESGMYEYDSSLAYIHIKDAQKLLGMKDLVTGIEVQVKNIDRAGKIAETIASGLGFPFWARDWTQMNSNLFSALKLEKTVMFIILILIVLVAAFNIASTLIMMVMEKTRDIAILKAMGATNKSIRKIFVFKGLVIGSIGTFLGVCFGFILCGLLKQYKFIELPKDVYYITTLPVQLEALDVFLIACASLLICFLSTLYPARQASLLNPIDAIRYG